MRKKRMRAERRETTRTKMKQCSDFFGVAIDDEKIYLCVPCIHTWFERDSRRERGSVCEWKRAWVPGKCFCLLFNPQTQNGVCVCVYPIYHCSSNLLIFTWVRFFWGRQRAQQTTLCLKANQTNISNSLDKLLLNASLTTLVSYVKLFNVQPVRSLFLPFSGLLSAFLFYAFFIFVAFKITKNNIRFYLNAQHHRTYIDRMCIGRGEMMAE